MELKSPDKSGYNSKNLTLLPKIIILLKYTCMGTAMEQVWVSRVSRDGLESRRPVLCVPVSYRKADLEWPLIDQEVKMHNFTPWKRKKCLKMPSPTLWKVEYTQPWPHVSHLSITLGHLFTCLPYSVLPSCSGFWAHTGANSEHR